jgi:Ca-activated chloride channel family protein
MKKALWVQPTLVVFGALAALLLALLLTGWADADDAMKKTIRSGNRQYSSAEYGEALAHYKDGLSANPQNKALSLNAALAAYSLGEYESAAQYYENAEDCYDKHLGAGNSYFRAGGAAQDASQKMQYYAQAMQAYEEGIDKYPQNVPLKYNYETVRQRISELLDEMEQENGDGDEQGEGEEQENGDEDKGDGEEQDAEQGEGEEQDAQRLADR